MSAGSGYELAELRRRLDNLVTIGRVEALDVGSARARVRTGGRLTGWRPWLTRRAGGDRDWWAPEPGEQVVVLSPSGDPEQSVILPALYSIAFEAPASSRDVTLTEWEDGALDRYDRGAHERLIEIPAGGGITFRCGGVSLRLDADGLHLVGAMDATIDVVADGVSLVNHKHTEVMPGAALSGPPEK